MKEEIKSCCNCPNFNPIENTCNYDIKIPARKIELNNLSVSKKSYWCPRDIDRNTSIFNKPLIPDESIKVVKDVLDKTVSPLTAYKDTNHFETAGSRFNKGKLRWSLVDLKYLEGLVQVLMNGAEKYSDYNWQKGLPTLEIYESLMRHIVAWRSGEDKDKESGLDHIDHAICNLYFMKWMIANKPSFDTRKTIMPEQEFTEPKYPSENEK